MNRISLTTEGGLWFDGDAATVYEEKTFIQKGVTFSLATNMPGHHERLYHTRLGAWIKNTYSESKKIRPKYFVIPEENAAAWFLHQSTELPQTLMHLITEFEV